MKSKLLGIKLLKRDDLLSPESLRSILMDCPHGLQEIMALVKKFDIKPHDQLHSWDDDGFQEEFLKIAHVTGLVEYRDDITGSTSKRFLLKNGWEKLQPFEDTDLWVKTCEFGEFGYAYTTGIEYSPSAIFYVRRG